MLKIKEIRARFDLKASRSPPPPCKRAATSLLGSRGLCRARKLCGARGFGKRGDLAAGVAHAGLDQPRRYDELRRRFDRDIDFDDGAARNIEEEAGRGVDGA